MFIAILTLLSALSISGVAAYYSIIGLATIFPGAFIPVVLMGSVLEAGKLVCASWLYRNWKSTNFFLRSYLFFAVIVLSLVTSMGIFGFLSKAHLQNEFADGSVQQKIELINSQIRTEESIITRQQEIINRSFGKDTSTTVRLNQLNERLQQLDKEVEAYTAQGTGVFKGDLVKKGLELKKTQQAERDAIQKEIQTLTNKSTANTQEAENKIAASQKKITDLITKRDPLIADKLKLEAEIGPIKYIAALAVDFGWSKEVNANSAVRWVIIILIFVFDPLAVLMLVAANQSFIKRFPVREDPPEEIIDLEKPDLDPPPPPPSQPKINKEDPAVTQWNSMIDRMNQLAAKEREVNNKKLENTVKQWQDKLDQFNEKIEKTIEKKDNSVTYNIGNILSEEPKPEEPEEERIKPNLTEVIEPETKFENTKKPTVGTLGQVTIDNKTKKPIDVEKSLPLPKNDFERTGMLNKFHKEHGKFQDISDEELKQERDEGNKAQFLSEVSVTEEDAKNHPPITKSRMAFFQDYIDDVLRGNTKADMLPPDVAKTVAILLSNYENPKIIDSVEKTIETPTIQTMTTEGLVEKFQPEPETEERDMTEEELDGLLNSAKDDNEFKGEDFDIVIQNGKKIRVPKQGYKQNEEQKISNNWSKILPIDEPEKNDIILPTLNTVPDELINDIPETTQNITIEKKLPNEQVQRHKKRMISDEEYRQRVEERINQLISQIDNGNIKLEELTKEDQDHIIELLKSNV